MIFRDVYWVDTLYRYTFHSPTLKNQIIYQFLAVSSSYTGLVCFGLKTILWSFN
jgi:hypothetical protein